jgi:Uma2 family endonuclease
MSDPAYAYDEERRWTYADYKEWELKPGERFELINGTAYAMAGAGTRHQAISMVLSAKLFNYFEGKICRPFAAPFDVRLFYEDDDSDDTVVQPDLVVVCDPEKLGKEGCRGAPDLVIEILSPSNSVIEMHRKLFLYESAGVMEYWVINPEEKVIEVYRQDGEHFQQSMLRTGDVLRPEKFPSLEIPVESVFA